MLLWCSPVAAATHPGSFAAGPKVTITEFNDLPQASGFAFPECVTAGPDRALWVTEDVDQDFGSPSIVKIGVDGRRLADYRYSEIASPAGLDIVAGPANAVWFTDEENTSIWRLSTGGGFTKYSIGSMVPQGLAFGPDGAFWFAEIVGRGAYAVGRMAPRGQVTNYSMGLSSDAALFDIVAGPDRAMWFTETSGNRIGRITTGTHVITEFRKGITPGSDPYSIAPGPDGALWFTERRGRRIGRITTGGVVTESAVLPSGARPNDIAAGPDGAMWFTEDRPSMIGRITIHGAITEYSGVSAGSEPGCIAAGPDGNMWFTEYRGNRMGRVNLRS
jgi:virginiamycin B lyase